MIENLKAYLVWLLPRVRFLLVAMTKLIFLTLFSLSYGVVTLDTTLILYGLLIVVFAMSQPDHEDMTGKERMALWGLALILVGLVQVYVTTQTGNYSNLLSI